MSTIPAQAASSSENTRQLSIAEALDFSEAQVRDLITRAPGAMPTYTRQGRWVLEADPWAPMWCGGFLTGMMWVFARRGGDRWWHDQAEAYCRKLESRKTDASTHDIGFVLEPSWGRWYDEEPTDRARDVLIEGGRTMAARLQTPGGYLSTWVDAGSTFIDIMMNVGIIFRAAEYSGDRSLYETALRHCDTSRKYLMRGDGSTAHEGWFDTASGEFLRTETHQGWRSDSAWARGQAWAIYGFTTAYRHTGRADMLDAARRAADYYIQHTPMGAVPPNDWADPAPQQPWEASAGAVATAGMLHLHDVLAPDDPDAPYLGYALEALRTLRSTEFIAADVPDWEGILRHATYHSRKALGVDESVMWGDYYFVEALELASRGAERP